jgi:hypothetical protein
VLLHVGEVDEKIERFAGQHLVNVGIVVRDFESFRLIAGALGADVAQAHDFDVGTFGEHRQIRMPSTPLLSPLMVKDDSNYPSSLNSIAPALNIT